MKVHTAESPAINPLFIFRCIGTGIHQSHTFSSNGGQLKPQSDSDSPSSPSSSWPSSTKLSLIYVLDMMHFSCVKLQLMTGKIIVSLRLLPHQLNQFHLVEIVANALLPSICVVISLPPNPSSDLLSLPSPIFIACSWWWFSWLIMLICAFPWYLVPGLVTFGLQFSFLKPIF